MSLDYTKNDFISAYKFISKMSNCAIGAREDQCARYTLIYDKNKRRFVVTDNFPKEPYRPETFWDDITRLRVQQLDDGAVSLVDTKNIFPTDETNSYKIANAELSQTPVYDALGKKYRRKKTSDSVATFELSQDYFKFGGNEGDPPDGNYLIVSQLSGSAFFPSSLLGNKFFFSHLVSTRTKQLNLGIESLDKTDLTESFDIASSEISKGIIINGEFAPGTYYKR